MEGKSKKVKGKSQDETTFYLTVVLHLTFSFLLLPFAFPAARSLLSGQGS
jgi:hypothetical protein